MRTSMANMRDIVNTLAALGAGTSRRFGDEAAGVRSLPCLVTGGLSVAVHVSENGGRFDLIPLSEGLEAELHDLGAEAFGIAHGLDLRAEADRVALLHDAPLGVRGLAQRWAMMIADPDHAQWISDDGCALDDYEGKVLIGWVRREMQRAEKRVYDGLVDAVGERLTHSEIEVFAYDRDVLTGYIAQTIGITVEQSRALCELAFSGVDL